MFSFFNNLETLKQKDFQLKTNFKHTIINPINQYDRKKSLDDIKKIDVTLKMCTLFKGVPHGLAIIEYIHPNLKS